MRLNRLLAFAAFAAGVAVMAAGPADAAGLVPLTKQQIKLALKAQLKAERQKKKVADAADAAAGEKAAADAAAAKAKADAAKAKAASASKPAARKDPAALAALIDGQIDRKLADGKVVASPLCTDAEFLRRASLDITGVIPTADQARTFLDSTAPDKRAKLVDELLDSPLYGRRQADQWQAKLFPRDSANRFVLREPFVKWLEEQFNGNTPWDKFVSDLVTATGTVEANPAVTFFLANRAVDKLTDHTTNHFLGIQLQCAQCHNHPFVKEWKQTDYWGVAAFYSKVQPQNPKNANKGGDNTQIGVQETPNRTKVKDFFPEATKIVPPKFFAGAEPKLSDREPLRPSLAKWLTGANNPYFAKAMVNRTWAQFFGPGIVNPVEDMKPDNPPSHPELLDGLAKEFANGFDLKHLIRGICTSKAYQRSSRPAAGNEKAEENLFAHQTVKVMTPEQLFDSLAVVGGGAGEEGRGGKKGAGAAKGQPNSPRERFVAFFLAGAEETTATEYDAGIPQALRLMNSRMTAAGPGLARSIAGTGSPAQGIEKIYLAALSRRPTPAEAAKLASYVGKAATPAEGMSDVLWAVLNSSEFTMVR